MRFRYLNKMMLKTALAIIALMYATRNFADGQAYKQLKDFNKDTAAYLKFNFIDHKSQYISIPVDKLVSALEIPIAIVYPNEDVKSVVNSFSLLFYNDTYWRGMLNGHSFVGLAVTFAPPVSTDSIDTYYYKSEFSKSRNPLPWANKQKLFFGNRIVKDIEKIFN